MAYGSGLAYGFSAEILEPLLGATAGGSQVALTTLADSAGTFGAPWVPQVWPSNGELINTISGGLALGAVTFSAAKGSGYLQQHPKTRVAVLAYGLTLVAGWIIPGLVRFLNGTGVFRAGGRRGGGRRGGGSRYAFIPDSPLRANAARGEYGSGATSQSNQVVLRRLFTAQ